MLQAISYFYLFASEYAQGYSAFPVQKLSFSRHAMSSNRAALPLAIHKIVSKIVVPKEEDAKVRKL